MALTRPKLRRGAEWKLSTINGLFSMLLLVTALMSHAWWVLGAAASFYWPGQWVLRQAAKHDPQWLAVYTRALSHPLVREPHGYAFTRDSRPRSIIPPAPRWVK